MAAKVDDEDPAPQVWAVVVEGLPCADREPLLEVRVRICACVWKMRGRVIVPPPTAGIVSKPDKMDASARGSNA